MESFILHSKGADIRDSDTDVVGISYLVSQAGRKLPWPLEKKQRRVRRESWGLSASGDVLHILEEPAQSCVQPENVEKGRILPFPRLQALVFTASILDM